jgi:malonyl-CoA decarboxylase
LRHGCAREAPCDGLTKARLERLSALGDLSTKGSRQSFGLMVNYLYDLDKVEAHHEKCTQGEIAQSRAIASLL